MRDEDGQPAAGRRCWTAAVAGRRADIFVWATWRRMWCGRIASTQFGNHIYHLVEYLVRHRHRWCGGLQPMMSQNVAACARQAVASLAAAARAVVTSSSRKHHHHHRSAPTTPPPLHIAHHNSILISRPHETPFHYTTDFPQAARRQKQHLHHLSLSQRAPTAQHVRLRSRSFRYVAALPTSLQ